MKILDLQIKGFRSLKEVRWKPGALNVVIGQNGTGKSNLLRLLELISVLAQGRLNKYIISKGGMDPLVWDGAVDAIQFRLVTNSSRTELEQDASKMIYEAELSRLGKGPSYVFGREALICEMKERSKPFVCLERNGPTAKVYHELEMGSDIPQISLSEVESALLAATGPFGGSEVITSFQQQLASWAIYHDVSTFPESPLRQSAVARFEKRVEPDGQNLIPVLHTLYTGNRDFKDEINRAMAAAFGDDFDELVFPPAADQRIQLRVRWKSLKREQAAADLSDGMLRFLLLLTILASPSPAPLIAIDEPETGLHPSMLPIVAEYAVDAATRTQVIFTTHSPQLLDAFVGEKPTTTVAKWENGETHLQILDEQELEYWLKEYTLGSLFKSGELEGMTFPPSRMKNAPA